MSSLMETLATIHRLYRRIETLEEEAQRGPAALKVGQTDLQKKRELLDKAQAEAKRAKVDLNQKELLLRSTEGTIQRLAGQLNQAKTNKEYQALLLESETAKASARKLEDEILQLLERLEDRQRVCDHLAAQIAQDEQTLQEQQARWQSQQGTMQAQIADVRRELQAAEAALPGGILPEYRRITAGRGADGLAAAAEGICQGCFNTLTRQTHNNLLVGRDLVPCQSCGRILYLPD